MKKSKERAITTLLVLATVVLCTINLCVEKNSDEMIAKIKSVVCLPNNPDWKIGEWGSCNAGRITSVTRINDGTRYVYNDDTEYYKRVVCRTTTVYSDYVVIKYVYSDGETKSDIVPKSVK